VTLTTRLLFYCLAIVLLYLALSGVDWPAFIRALATMNAGWVGLCLVFEFVGLLIRAYRWSLLLQSQSGRCLFTAFIGETIGDLGNTFLPARAGEAARTFLVARRLDIKIPFVIGTAITERVGDAVFLSLTAFTMILLVPQSPHWLIGAAIVFFIIGVVVLVNITFMGIFNDIFRPWLQKLPLPKRIFDKIVDLPKEISIGAQAFIGHPARLAVYLGLTTVIWVADAAAIICLANSLDGRLSFPEAMIFVAGLGLASAIPSTPGYIGIYQFVAVSVLVPFGMNQTQAIALILVFQITVIVQELLFGGIGWLFLYNRSGPAKPASDSNSTPTFPHK
jgi:glycosyltransferase 2 family protein